MPSVRTYEETSQVFIFFFNAKAYGHVYKLVDIPKILESYKTVDKKTFFKTADICQMLGCSNEGEDSGSGREEKRSPHKNTDKVNKKFLWNHGLTPPLKNVRK
ncbi:transcription initiation factor TFIID subunit 7-like isoform X3 [Anneissia japonica]|uniref:transcription initiation factor TFIID subunit 7-like isoform X3 n=1 Tax=Anneissia japonica TaxID=1529436 RepID=UPI00142586DE|nr:transcription initiation factor TFIID subunit 7-like isoform X3 [Anneissia japonica]